MSQNAYRALQALLPQPAVLVGVVTAIHADDTSTVQLPGPGGLAGYAANVFTGSLIRARGATVPVGQRAFVRDWPTGYVIETQAPPGPILDLPIGALVLPAPPPPPAPPPAPATGAGNKVRYRGATADIQYLSQYAVRNTGVVGLGGSFTLASVDGYGPFWALSSNDMVATSAATSFYDTSYLRGTVDIFAKANGVYAVEIVIEDISTSQPEFPTQVMTTGQTSEGQLYFLGGYRQESINGPMTIGTNYNTNSSDSTGSTTTRAVIGDVFGFVLNRHTYQGHPNYNAVNFDVYRNGIFFARGIYPEGAAADGLPVNTNGFMVVDG